MTSAMRSAPALLVLAALATPGLARAETANRAVIYRVKPGDTLELIAAEFYGDRTKTVFLIDENKLTRPRPLRPGERLRVPVSHEITTAPGDNFESLAKTYLASGLRSSFLADWNNRPLEDSLPAGTPLTIPFTITHVAGTTESLAEIARLYYGDGKNAEMLRRYNQLEKTSIDKGEQLIVPAYHVRLSPAKQPALDAEARARRDRRSEAMGRALRALPVAHNAWRDGDFKTVTTTLTPVEPELDYLDTDVAVDIALLLGSAYIAFDDGEHAQTCFQYAFGRKHEHVLQRYLYSPKILAVWQKVGGTVE